METKKTYKANLENKRTLLTEVGLVAAMGIVLMAFEWGTPETKVATLAGNDAAFISDDIEIPVTMETPPTPPAPAVILNDLIEILPDDIKIDEDLEFKSLDDSQMEIPIMDYIPQSVQDEEVDEAPVPFFAVEEKPLFNGGDANEFSKWVNSNLKYPSIAQANGVEGRVTLQFTVNTDGSVSNVKVLRGVDSSLDNEAVRVVSMSPKWTPGRQRDRAVKVTYTFPVIFKLR